MENNFIGSSSPWSVIAYPSTWYLLFNSAWICTSIWRWMWKSSCFFLVFFFLKYFLQGNGYTIVYQVCTRHQGRKQ